MSVWRSERGVALALVLVVGILLSITVAVTLNVTGYRWYQASREQQRGQSFYAAEAAIQATFGLLHRGLLGDPATWPLVGSVRVRKLDSSTTPPMQSIGGKTIEVTLTYDPSKPGEIKIESLAKS